MAVSKRLRFEILRRDNHTCRYCGRGAPEVALTVDHVIPETLGGTDDPTNLVAACADCNSGKSSVPADATVVPTTWAAQQIDDLVIQSEDTAARWLTQESIDSAHCTHKSWGEGDCGDPICRVRRAEALGWMSYSNMLDSDRATAVVEAAEGLLDG